LTASERSWPLRSRRSATHDLNLEVPVDSFATTLSIPLEGAPAEARAAYLRRVLGLVLLGLVITALTGFVSMFAIATEPRILYGYAPMAIILGCWAVTNYLAPRLVFGKAKLAGFLLGTVFQGVSLGFLLLVAILFSKQEFGSPFHLIFTALTLTVLSGMGLALYTTIQRRDFSMIGAGLGVVSLPMLGLMAVSFAFPQWIGGTAGIVVSGIFVLVSAAGLLYQIDRVLHHYTTEMHVEGAYTITIGVVILFWNILSLLMRLRRR
jgi:FtsH-binding integral membrane protein